MEYKSDSTLEIELWQQWRVVFGLIYATSVEVDIWKKANFESQKVSMTVIVNVFLIDRKFPTSLLCFGSVLTRVNTTHITCTSLHAI
jgi:hypothetical protein